MQNLAQRLQLTKGKWGAAARRQQDSQVIFPPVPLPRLRKPVLGLARFFRYDVMLKQRERHR